MKINPYYQRQNVGQWFYFLEIRFVRIFAGGAEWQWGSWKRRCSDISFEISDSTYAVPRRLFSDPKMRDLEWPLNVIQGFVLVLAPDASASTRLPCLAYTNVPLSTYCKIWYVSKFTAARLSCNWVTAEQILQGSATTDLRRCGKFYLCRVQQ